MYFLISIHYFQFAVVIYSDTFSFMGKERVTYPLSRPVTENYALKLPGNFLACLFPSPLSNICSVEDLLKYVIKKVASMNYNIHDEL